MSQLRAGVARAVITPPVGIGMVGFAGRGAAEGVHDELTATALALESGDTRAAVIALDLLGVGEMLTSEVRAEVERRTGIPAANVHVCASHTHYGPMTDGYASGELPDDVRAYLANLEYLLAGAVQAAYENLRPVRIGFGRGQCDIGINRREKRPDGTIVLGQNPNGACDREVNVVRIDDFDGIPIAVVVNFACHPVSLGSQMRQISADFVSLMRRTFESDVRTNCLFLQGAAGNINPIEMLGDFDVPRRLSGRLSAAVRQALAQPQELLGVGMAAASQVVDLPAMRFDSAEEGESGVAMLKANLDRLREQGADSGPLYWARARLERAERMLESVRTGISLPAIRAEMAAFRFGDVALVTAPGEIFCETGMDVKRRSPIRNTMFVGYTNGSIGYVPTRESFPEGGYEVTHACRVAPESAEMISDTCLRLLNKIDG